MAGADFRVDLLGRSEVERTMFELLGRMHDLTPLMDTVGAVIESDVQDNFQGEHSPEGIRWKPSQRVLEHGGKTLQLSRRLAQSVTHRAGHDFVEVGTNVIYAGRHQDGFHGAERVASHRRTMREVFGHELAEPIEVTVGAFTRTANTPARPFLGISAGASAEILAIAAEYAGAGD